MDYEMNDEGTQFTSTMLTVLVGAAIGAAAALILAPATGRDTRAYLGRQGKRLADDVAAQGRRAWAEHGERVTQAGDASACSGSTTSWQYATIALSTASSSSRSTSSSTTPER